MNIQQSANLVDRIVKMAETARPKNQPEGFDLMVLKWVNRYAKFDSEAARILKVYKEAGIISNRSMSIAADAISRAGSRDPYGVADDGVKFLRFVGATGLSLGPLRYSLSNDYVKVTDPVSAKTIAYLYDATLFPVWYAPIVMEHVHAVCQKGFEQAAVRHMVVHKRCPVCTWPLRMTARSLKVSRRHYETCLPKDLHPALDKL